MQAKTLVAIPAVLLGLAAVPALALDVSIGGSADASVSAESSDSDGSLSVDLGASGSADVESDADDGDSGGSVSAGGSASGSASGSVNGGSTDASASAGGSAGGSASLDLGDDPLESVLDLIRNSDWDEDSLIDLDGVDGSTFDVSAWITSENSIEFEQALNDNAEEIAELHAAIQANAELNAWLDSEDADASAVVAVGVAADGSLAVFTYE